MSDDPRFPLVRRGLALPAVEQARYGLLRLQGRPLSVDMDVWEGLRYGPAPEQTLDAWELVDLAPREGWPAVLFVHGGGWISGHRDAFRVQAPRLARKGVLSAAASYRLAPEHRWPAQLDDLLAAIERLKGMQVDDARIALWGVSAGGHLALLAAQALGPEHIRAVVTVGAPTDLPALEASGYRELGQVFDPEQLAGASPALDERPLPPVLALHGERDPVVPVQQARSLAAAHPSVEVRVVEGGDHGLRFPPRRSRQAVRYARAWIVGQLADKHRTSKWKLRKKKER